LDYKTLAQEVQGELMNGKFGAAHFRGVAIDSRAVVERQLFIAIRGTRDDGHKYIRNIMNIPGVGLLVRRGYEALPEIYNDIPVVAVEDTHRAMIELARGYRRRLKCFVIAVTGSTQVSPLLCISPGVLGLRLEVAGLFAGMAGTSLMDSFP